MDGVFGKHRLEEHLPQDNIRNYGGTWAVDHVAIVTTQLDPPRTAFYQVRNLVEQVAGCGEMAIGSGPVFQS